MNGGIFVYAMSDQLISPATPMINPVARGTIAGRSVKLG
jgi:hypothetical protein